MKKIFFILCIVCFTGFFSLTNSFAMTTGFKTTEKTVGEVASFSHMLNIELIYEEPQRKPFVAFDINKDGLIALAVPNSGLRENVLIYDQNGIFLYGYSFKYNKGNYGVEWDENNLNIYFPTGTILSVDKNGDIIEIRSVPANSHNRDYKKVIFESEQSLDGIKFEGKNTGFWGSFAFKKALLVKTDATGNETFIYDVRDGYYSKIPFIVGAIILFIATIAGILIKYMLIDRKALKK